MPPPLRAFVHGLSTGLFIAKPKPKQVDYRHYDIANLRVALAECFTGANQLRYMNHHEALERLREIDAIVEREVH